MAEPTRLVVSSRHHRATLDERVDSLEAWRDELVGAMKAFKVGASVVGLLAGTASLIGIIRGLAGH